MRLITPKQRSFLIIFAFFCLLSLSAIACSKAVTTNLTQEEDNNRVAFTATHVAATGLGEILKNVTDEAERVKIIQEFIDPIRFYNDKSGYFYVYNYNCVNIAHAINKSLVGQDLTEHKDMKGMLDIQALRDAAKNGGGYVTFYWPHPETKVEQKKIGYVEPIPGTDYFIGTGYYPDTK
jgi:signal transduction histidine kinase